MSLLAALPTADPVARLHADLDELANVDADRLDAAGKASMLASMARAEAKFAAIKLGLLAAAERSHVAASAGLANTGQWAARATNADPVAVHRHVQLSQRLEHRTSTQQALAAGRLSSEHAAVIVQADQQLPAGVSAAQRLVVEEALIAQAQTMAPTLLRRAARRALAEIEPDVRVVDAHENALVADEEAHARSKTRLTLHDNQDGTVTGHFTVPTLHGQLLRKILETITAPRRRRLGASVAQVGDNVGLRTDWDRARGAAFCEILEHLPTPRSGSSRPGTNAPEERQRRRAACAVSAPCERDLRLDAGAPQLQAIVVRFSARVADTAQAALLRFAPPVRLSRVS